MTKVITKYKDFCFDSLPEGDYFTRKNPSTDERIYLKIPESNNEDISFNAISITNFGLYHFLPLERVKRIKKFTITDIS